jgi:hypothetical protein
MSDQTPGTGWKACLDVSETYRLEPEEVIDLGDRLLVTGGQRGHGRGSAPDRAPNVNPSVPAFGGPTGVGAWGGTGSTVHTYGNSSLRGGVSALSPKQGVFVQHSPDGWSDDVYTFTPGIPGDSGSGFLNASSGAIGVLSTVQLAPLAGSKRGRGPSQGARLREGERLLRGRPRPGHRAVEPRRRWGRSEGHGVKL